MTNISAGDSGIVMSRPWRIEFEGALYHVLARGNNRRDIFLDDEDFNILINLLGEMSSRFDVDVFAYVLMNNHYHILLRTNSPNLSKAMQWIGVTYTRRFNNRHVRSGHLFQGRFKSLIVQNDAYLVQLSCYIHRNPLRAGIVKRLIDYKWSSYPVYAYGRRPQKWLENRTILSQFGTEDQHQAYRTKVQRYSGEERSLFEDLRHGLFVGTAEFADKLRSQFLEETPHPEMPQQIKLSRDHELEKLINKLLKALGCNLKMFRESLRISEADKISRDFMLFILWQTGRFTNREIAKVFGLSYSSVSKRVSVVRNRLHEDKVFKNEFDRVNMLIKM